MLKKVRFSVDSVSPIKGDFSLIKNVSVKSTDYKEKSNEFDDEFVFFT